MRGIRSICLAGGVAAIAGATSAVAQTAGLYREVFTGMPDGSLSSLTNHPSYPDNAALKEVFTNGMETTSFGDHYGQRFRALIRAPATGSYRFWIASDDNGVLYLGTNTSESSKREIASVPEWTNFREFGKYASQRSSLQYLVANQSYYFEVLQVEGGGGDHLTVQWRLPSGVTNTPIPASYFTPAGLAGPLLVREPGDATAVENGAATFTVQASSPGVPSYRWQRDGADLAGATNAAWTTGALPLSESGRGFRCIVSDAWGAVTTRTATLTVLLNPAGGFYREIFTGISGGTLDALTNNAAYPDSPSSDVVQTGGLETVTYGESYGQRLRAFLRPPATGSYTFWIASDDNSILQLSTDSSPDAARVIASVPGWTDTRQFTQYAEQQSAPQVLSSNQLYYLEVLHAEGWGGDHACVRWQRPSGAIETPIPDSALIPAGVGPPVILQEPADTNVQENTAAVFAVVAARPSTVTYRWQRDGADIPGATASVYDTGPLPLAGGNHGFRCILANAAGVTTTRVAQLTVYADTTRPTIESVSFALDPALVSVVFSEPVDLATATNPANYGLSGGALLSVSIGPDNRTVVLRTTARTEGGAFTLEVSNVSDLASTPNTILAGTQRFFVQPAVVPLDPARVRGASEPAGPSSRRTGLVIDEIMYHPPDRTDGRNGEFVEIFNPQPFHEDLGGFRLSGEIDYTFPTGTVLGAGGRIVVAPAPADVAAIYGATNVVGGFTNRLANGGGTLRLRNELGAILLEADYDDEAPWSAAADGAGHSLALARPSYGEGDPRAWAASELAGGSPSRPEPPPTNAWRTVMINEILAHTDLPDVDYVELFNYGAAAVSIAGCVLTDDPATNRFTIPGGATIPARGFAVFTQDQLGFALGAAGETVWLKSPAGDRVIDAVRFDAQENGVSSGRAPDGSPLWSRLQDKTPGAANGARRPAGVAIGEIFYHPPTDIDGDEFVEVVNRTAAPVNLEQWRLQGGIAYTFPSNAWLAAGGRAVVARDRARLLAGRPGLAPADVYGDYDGSLADGGERLALAFPDDIVATNAQGQVTVDRVHIVVDETTWGDDGRWGAWSDGGGSSLERVDPRSDGRRAPDWADSDETAKSAWTNLQATGVIDNSMGDATQLHVFLNGAGECLLDDVEVFTPGGPNLVDNPGFESGATGWTFQGTMEDSAVTTNGAYAGARALVVRAVDRGDTGANRIRVNLASTPWPGQTVTIRAKVRWLRGNPDIVLRLRGNGMELAGRALASRDLGTPGAPNSRGAANGPPSIADVRHEPLLPAAGQPVLVTAAVDDPDGLSVLRLRYRVDPSSAFATVVMTNRGAGYFSASIPGQAAGALVAFHLEAADGGSPVASSRFPSDAPARECLVRFGEPAAGGASFATYRLWVTQTNATRWASREKNSNRPLDATFVYGTARAVYNAGTLYSGSPWHTGSYNGPAAEPACDYVVNVPQDDPVLGRDNLTLATVGNLSNDDSLQREQAAFWILRRMGAPSLHKRHVKVVFNGSRRGSYYEDTQQPGSEVMEQWYPDGADGPLHKVEDWFEFDDAGSSFDMRTARLERYTTTGGALKPARYRWIFRRRAAERSMNDYTNLLELVETINLASPETRVRRMETIVDVENWMRAMTLERVAGNWDSYGWERGKNLYIARPAGGRWVAFAWDIDMVFGSGSRGETEPVTPANNCEDPVLAAWIGQPSVSRAWWRSLQSACDAMADARLASLMNAKYAALAADGYTPSTAPSTVLSWIAARRAYILGELAKVAAPFALASPSTVTSPSNTVVLSGTAPVGVHTLAVNGVGQAATWTSLTNWTLSVALANPTNALSFQGLDANGLPVAGATGTVTAVCTSGIAPPAGSLVIAEIQYNPLVAAGGFVEIENRSASTAFDLSRWRLEGADFSFPDGTTVAPTGRLVVVEDRVAFERAYGTNLAAIAGVYEGRLDGGGETLRLVKPGVTPAEDETVDEVTYDDGAPWPALADGFGPSLQCINSALDNNRVANWAATTSAAPAAAFTPASSNRTGLTLSQLPAVWLNEAQPLNATGAADRMGDRDPWCELYNAGAGAVSLAGYALSDSYTNLARWTFPSDATLQPGQFAVVWLDAEPGETVSNEWHASFRPAAPDGSLALSAMIDGRRVVLDYLNYRLLSADRSHGAWPDATPAHRRRFHYATPGAPNNPAEPAVQLYINEWMASNAGAAADPADGDYDDWFEIFNAGAEAADLSGYTLTDDPAQPREFVIPDGVAVPAGGHLLVWADEEEDQNAPGSPHLHVNFKLGATADNILLFKPDGTPVDSVSFGPQTNNVSQGRWPDGNAAPFPFFAAPTPGAPNRNPNPNRAPSVGPVGDRTADEEALLTVAIPAADPDGDSLSFELRVDPPDGASIHGGSGVFAWTPSEEQGPGVYGVTVRATDNGYPPLFAETSFAITVREVLRPPQLLGITNRFVAEGNRLSVIAAAVDPDVPAHEIRFRFEGLPPDGGALDPVSGEFAWTPSEAQGPGTYAIGVAAYDPAEPGAASTGSFEVVVGEVNQSPRLEAVADQFVWAGATMRVLAQASDDDVPTNALSFQLAGDVPPGASVNADSGELTWTPAAAGSTNTITLRVADNGTPALQAERTIRVVVPSEAFQFTAAERAGAGGLNLAWTSIPGRRYRLEWKEKLTDAEWTLVQEIVATGSACSLPLAAGTAGAGHFRVVEQP